MSAIDDPRVKPHVRAAAAEFSRTFGITDIGGFATTGHIPDSDHYKGLAIDVMTTVKGRDVSNYAVANANRLCITYVIWNHGIWDSRDGKGWVPYHGTNPHTNHVHVSFFPTCDGTGQPIVTTASASADPTQNSGCAQLIIDLFGF